MQEKVLNSFKSRLFPTREQTEPELATEPELPTEPEPATEPEVATKTTKAKTKGKMSSLKLCEEFLNKIKNEKKNINEQSKRFI